MRSRYRVNELERAHFVTATIINWLPVFTTAACCDILVASLTFCQSHKALRIYGWVILDNHFHALLAGPNLARTLGELKRHSAKQLLAQLELDGRDWLVRQFDLRRAPVQDREQAPILARRITPTGNS